MSLEYRENIKIYKDIDNKYHTNTGCRISIYKDNGVIELLAECDRPITYDEVKAIRYNLLNRSRTYYFDIDEYGYEVRLKQEKSKPKYNHNKSEILLDEFITSSETSERYKLLITLDGGVQTHMSVSRASKDYIPLSELLTLRCMYLPKDKKYAMLLPPEEEFVNVHHNCFHLYEII